jgi:hypothetical protein
MARPTKWQLLALVTIALSTIAAAQSTAVPTSDWAKARVQGKYRVLLRQIKAPEDRAAHSEFQDLGLRESTEWKGQRDLPVGYWVYVFPYWYIWRDEAAPAGAKPAYHADQATGPPDTPGPGDQPTAWASATPDGEAEWLELEYAKPVVPRSLKVYEICAPGAITKVSVFALDGAEKVVWSGKDPTPSYRPMGVSLIPVRVDHPIARVRIHLNSPAFPGWNEIDAVGLVDASGKTQWADAASASTTFGQGNVVVANQGAFQQVPTYQPGSPPVPSSPALAAQSGLRQPVAQILRRLEAEVQQTRKQYEELKKLLESSQAEIKTLKAELDALKRKTIDSASGAR